MRSPFTSKLSVDVSLRAEAELATVGNLFVLIAALIQARDETVVFRSHLSYNIAIVLEIIE